MGHRWCIVCHRPTTLPGAPSRTHRCRLGHGDKKRASSRSPRSPRSPTTYVIILEGRRPGGSIGAAFRSIVHLLLFLPCPVVKLCQPILIPRRFDELYDRLRERPIARSSWSTTTASCILETRSGKSINEFAESSVRDQACATGIQNEYRTCEYSIGEFQARSRVLERPGGPLTSDTPVAADVECSFRSILILLSILGFPLSQSSIRFVKSIQPKNSRINRLESIVDIKKRFLIVRLTFAFPRLSHERAIIRVKHVPIFLGKLSESVNQFSQPVILEAIDSYETIRSSSSGKSFVHVAAPFRAAVMRSGRRTLFR